MKVDLEKLENSRVKLTIDTDAAKLEEGLAFAYRKVVKDITIPGFRKGKAPRKIVERFYGETILYEDALDFLIPQLYEAAVKETEINPVDQPDVDLNNIEPGKGLSLSFEVDVYPEVQLDKYTGLAVEKLIRTVSDEDVNLELEQLRMRHSELASVDSRDDVQEGDFVNLDFKGYLDGTPFPGGAAEGHTLEIGSGQFIPGFEEQLVGLKEGEEKDINVTFPEEYHSEDLAGKAVVFKVKINNLKTRVLPELDDEFAKDVSEFETLAELTADTRAKLETSLTHEIKHAMENSLMEQMIASSEITLPQSMIDQQVEFTMNNFRMNLMYSGMSMEMFLEQSNKTEEELKAEMEPDAINQLKRSLILEYIAEQEEIVASEEEVNAKIEELISDSPDPERTKQELESDRDRLFNMVKIEKVWDFIIANSQVTEVEEVTEVDEIEVTESGEDAKEQESE